MSSQVVRFYEGRCVLVTGGTGFMGRVLIEKLLRSCHDISKIYLLLRTKAGGVVQDRIKDITDIPIFDELKKSQPQVFSKLVPMEGDITSPGLGLSPVDVEILKENVSVVFHLAARIKFDRNLKEATEMNVKGVRRILELCRQLPLLEALVHVSTCYFRLDHDELNEELYVPPVLPQKLIDSVDQMAHVQLEALTAKILQKFPNVYACTKAASEHLLNEERGNLPLVIVRPSIVTSTWKEPVAGWIDNLNGPSGFIAGTLTGFLRTTCLDPKAVGDMIPADTCINLIITAAWHKAVFKSSCISVYNCATGTLNPITWGRFYDIGIKIIRQNPSKTLMWYPNPSVSSPGLVYKMEIWLYHYLPAYIMDLLARLSGSRPKMVRMYDKAHRSLSTLDFYINNQWTFHTNNLLKLINVMSPADRQIFDCDVRSLDWHSYMKVYVLGTRRFVLKEDVNTVPAAKRKLRMFFWIRILLRFVLLLMLAWFFRWMLKTVIISNALSASYSFSLPGNLF